MSSKAFSEFTLPKRNEVLSMYKQMLRLSYRYPSMKRDQITQEVKDCMIISFLLIR